MTLAKLVLLWMLSLVPSSPWIDSYEETAQAIDDACEGDVRCGAVLTAIAYHESRFNPEAVGDRGQSVGVWQLSRSWRPEPGVDRHARLARGLVSRSFRICAARPMEERLGWFAAGRDGCGRPASSRIRMNLAKRLLGE